MYRLDGGIPVILFFGLIKTGQQIMMARCILKEIKIQTRKKNMKKSNITIAAAMLLSTSSAMAQLKKDYPIQPVLSPYSHLHTNHRARVDRWPNPGYEYARRILLHWKD